MHQTKIFHLFHSNDDKQVNIYNTDTLEEIKSRILVEINSNHPNFVFFPKNFSIQNLLKQNTKTDILDLEKIPILAIENKENGVIRMNLKGLDEIISKFEITKEQLFFYLLYRVVVTRQSIEKLLPKKAKATRLPGVKKVKEVKPTKTENDHKEKFIPIVEKISEKNEKSLFGSTYSESFLLNEKQNRLVQQFIIEMTKQFIKKSDFQFDFREKLYSIHSEMVRMKQVNEKNIKKSNELFSFINEIQSKKFTDTSYHGRIYDIHINTKHYTTSILFDNLELDEHLPIAHYNKFFKLFRETSTSAKTIHNNNLYIYRKEEDSENVQIFCQNTPNGIILQVLLLSNSNLSDLESVYQFLKLDHEKMKITSTKQKGILGEFEFNQSSFQSSYLNDMIMNHEIFNKFLSVNDSDKISRDNNSSYVYYKQSVQSDKTTKNIIEVGGWNKEISRFGELTATLTPMKKLDEYYIHVKIHRAYNEETLNEYKEMMGKLLNLYEKNEKEVKQYFHSYISNLILPPITEIHLSSKVGTLGYENKLLFPGQYPRVCQPGKRRKPILYKNENELTDLNLTKKELENRVMLFPKHNIIFENYNVKPNYYYCKDDEYPNVGFVKIKNLTEKHPFEGYAPCCYKKPQLEENKKIEKYIYEKDEFVKTYKMTGYKIKKSKIIEQTGQIGELPPNVKTFFTSLDPELNVVRVGIKNELAPSSLFYCCEYAIKFEPDFNINLDKNLRQTIIKETSFPIIAQENVLYGLNFIKKVMENEKNYINIRNVFRMVQEYYTINIIVITIDGKLVQPNSFFNYKSIYYDNEPFVILLEHENPIRYELIGVEKDKKLDYTLFSKSSSIYSQLKFTFENTLQIKENNIIDPIISYNEYNVWKTLKNTKLEGQILTKNGQCVVLLLKYKNTISIPIHLLNTLPPYGVKCKNTITTLPTLQDVESFLKESSKVSSIKISKINNDYSIVVLNNKFTIPFHTDSDYNFTNEISFHNVLFYIIKVKDGFANFASVYNVIHLMKDYILIKLGSFIKENNELKNIQNIITEFKSKCIEFVPANEYKVQETSCLKDKNQWMFSNQKLRLPHELFHIIDYFLEWNYRYNMDYIKNTDKTQQLDFFQFGTDFKHIYENNIQLQSKSFQNINYYPYFEFPIDSFPSFPFEEQKVYYHYERETSTIRPFLFFLKNSFIDNVTMYDKIDTIMDTYYKKGVLLFDFEEHVEETKFTERFDIYEQPKSILVFFQFK